MNAGNLENTTDGELIKLYVQQRGLSDAAMRELVARHSEQMYARFFAKVRNESDANDLQQELWTKVARSLDRYKDEEKFAHYLSKLASNLLIDFYRKSGREVDILADGPGSVGEDGVSDPDYYVSNYEDATRNVEEQVSDDELVQYLTTVLIPALPVEQRTAWLLRHESEYWEPARRFEWHHLAELNNQSEEETAAIFESARRKLMSASDNNRAALEEIELLVFLVWTQAQRLDKAQTFTWDYFAELLGQPVNTMKTRYRSAQRTLNQGLTEYVQK